MSGNAPRAIRGGVPERWVEISAPASGLIYAAKNSPCERKDQGDAVIGNLFDAVVGDVGHLDAAFGGNRHRNGINADAIAGNDLAVRLRGSASTSVASPSRMARSGSFFGNKRSVIRTFSCCAPMR